MQEPRPRFDVSLPPEVIAEVDVIRNIESGRVEVRPLPLPITGVAGVDIIRNIESGTVEIRPLPLPVTGIAGVTVGSFYQHLDQSVLTGESLVYSYDISSFDKKTIGVWSNTGDVRITLFISNDGTTFFPYYQTDISSGQYKTMSFTEVFKNLKVNAFGLTDAGYNILFGFM